jgi:hypothetical protein
VKGMKMIYRYKAVIAVVLPIAVLVLVRSFGINHFRNDAKKWAEPSVVQSNLILREQLGKFPGEKLIINLDNKNSENSEISGKVLMIPADSILSKNILNTIRKHKGPVLLYSSETGVSAKLWMVLSQMGYQKIYILTEDTDNEVFNYK